MSNMIMTAPEKIALRKAAELAEVGGFHANGEIILSGLIVVFCIMSFGFLYFSLKTGNATPFFLRIYIITIVIFGTLLVVSSAYANEQIAPVVGLFGTIAGYVLGRGEKENDKKDS